MKSIGQTWRRLALLASLGAVWAVFGGVHAFSADVVKLKGSSNSTRSPSSKSPQSRRSTMRKQSMAMPDFLKVKPAGPLKQGILRRQRRRLAASTTRAITARPSLSSTPSPRLLRFATQNSDEQGEDTIEADADERPIRALTTNILPSKGELPPNYAAARFAKSGDVLHTVGTSRPWMESVYDWEASAFCHRPLYFNEPYVERDGHSFGLLQPAVSGAHFFARIPALPYMVAAFPPHECIFTLGHARPGSYAPFRYIRLPLRLDAAAIQAGVVTGLVYLIP